MPQRPRHVRAVPKLPRRPRDAHKGDFGRVLVVGGSVGMVGAPALTANAALRSGAGLVKIACPACAQQTIAGLAPCATSVALPSSSNGLIAATAQPALARLVGEHDVVAFGPGLGRSAGLRKLLTTLLAVPGKPVVIDADGLNNLAQLKSWPARCKANVVVTPHPGEMQRLLGGADVSPDPKQRRAVAVAYATATGAVCVLKGKGTVVTDGRRIYVNDTGNPGMATAGSGDVLTGIVAALLGQGLSPFDAAVAGVHVHGRAGDVAAKRTGEIGLVATDLIDSLPAAFQG